MANRLFLSENEIQEFDRLLVPPESVPDGNERQPEIFSNTSVSQWLEKQVLARFEAHPEWTAAGPIALGSWARDELTPKSDFDLLFCGNEESVKKVVDEFNEKGLKIRYRMPANRKDWSEGVEVFDVLALLQAKPLVSSTAATLNEQQKIIAQSKVKRKWLNAIAKERKARSQRYDSIANFLEPNIKYGSGGLRDLHQGLQIYNLFQDRFTNAEHAIHVLNYYKNFFISVRQKLHLLGGQDILLAHFQDEIGKWLGFKDKKSFMGQLELGLSRVSFYSDWVMAQVRTAASKSRKIYATPLQKIDEALSFLKKEPNILAQYHVRQHLNSLFVGKPKTKEVGPLLHKYFSIDNSEQFFVSLFQARIIDRLIPNLVSVFGLVQHDQYHRFSVDAHILQAIKLTCRIHKSPKALLGMQKLLKKIKKHDWQILLWSCLYHDIAKGSGKPHHEEGALWVKNNFKVWNFSPALAEEVSWIVDRHLVLSRSAFRQNFRSPKTWQELNSLGVVGERLLRLAVFTAIDIQATNPEAWNTWKAKLLLDLYQVMTGEQTTTYFKFLGSAKSKKIKIPSEILERFDPALPEVIAIKDLLSDFAKLIVTKTDLPVLVVKPKRNSRGRLWIRFHRKQDRPGIFFEFVQKLFSLGVSIQQAFVQTYPSFGAYDWFEIKSNSSPPQFKKMLDANLAPKDLPRVKFQKVELVSQDEQEIVISFRGLDQPGVLINAVKALTDAGLTILWSRVLTWGRQIDDVFGIAVPKERTALQIIDAIKKSLGLTE